MPKFFLPLNSAPSVGEILTIGGADAAHIGRALRAKTGEELTIGDGEGNNYLCRIVSIGAQSVEAEVISAGVCAAEPKVPVTLFLALTKGDKFELALQKCVELGAVRIVPVLTPRCISRPDEAGGRRKVERWNKISEAAAKQSGRGIVPKVENITSFDAALKEFLSSPLPLFFYENAQTMLHDVMSQTMPQSAAAFIGPEGGFSPQEADKIIDGGGKPVSLGARILRAETAPIAVMAALSYALGEF